MKFEVNNMMEATALMDVVANLIDYGVVPIVRSFDRFGVQIDSVFCYSAAEIVSAIEYARDEGWRVELAFREEIK